jgi:hypothetical protein
MNDDYLDQNIIVSRWRNSICWPSGIAELAASSPAGQRRLTTAGCGSTISPPTLLRGSGA